MKHINIPIFIPHLGCPNLCIFCNQRYISGKAEFDVKEVKSKIEDVLTTVSSADTCEIAFFGGSFTGIDRELMIYLLDLAQGYVNMGKVAGIRMSTRPDYINEEIVKILKKYTITYVELGIQSMNDEVLSYIKRGHTSNDTVNAIQVLNKNKIPFVGQMMVGLPKATVEDEIECAEIICKCGAAGTRIYPTLVFSKTELEILTKSNEYHPLTVEDAVYRSALVLKVFYEHGVPCFRIGLCDSDNLHSEDTYIAGPNEPSIGEMVKSRMYFEIISEIIQNSPISLEGKSIIIECQKGKISQIIGQKRTNINKLKEKFGINKIKVKENESFKDLEIKIKEENLCD